MVCWRIVYPGVLFCVGVARILSIVEHEVDQHLHRIGDNMHNGRCGTMWMAMSVASKTGVILEKVTEDRSLREQCGIGQKRGY